MHIDIIGSYTVEPNGLSNPSRFIAEVIDRDASAARNVGPWANDMYR